MGRALIHRSPFPRSPYRTPAERPALPRALRLCVPPLLPACSPVYAPGHAPVTDQKGSSSPSVSSPSASIA